MPRISIDDKDIERGKRFREICESAFAGESFRSIGKLLGGYSSSRMSDWLSGDRIDNRALAALSRHGADIHYILTGERRAEADRPAAATTSAAAVSSMQAVVERELRPPPESCPNRGACEKQAKILRLFAGMLGLVSADDAEVERAVDVVGQALLDAIRRSNGAKARTAEPSRESGAQAS